MTARETLFSLVAAAALALPVAAQPPVFVELARGDLLGHGIVRAAAEERLAAVLAETTGAWDFEPAAGPTDFPRVVVALDERDGSWFYVVRFLAEPGEQAEEWIATFYDKAEVDLRGGLPALGRLPEVIAGRFGEVLRGGVVDGAVKLGWAAKDEEQEGVLFEALRGGAPVADGAHLPADDLDGAAIRLSFDERRALARSAFKIEAAHPAGRVVEVFAEGSGACREWPDPPPENAIKVALSVIVEPGRDPRPVAAGDLQGLAPGPVLLARYVEGSTLTCGEGPAPIVIGEELP